MLEWKVYWTANGTVVGGLITTSLTIDISISSVISKGKCVDPWVI